MRRASTRSPAPWFSRSMGSSHPLPPWTSSRSTFIGHIFDDSQVCPPGYPPPPVRDGSENIMSRCQRNGIFPLS